MIASPAPGAPRSPSIVATGPSFMDAPWASVGSSQWSITVRSKAFAYSRARRIMRALAIGRPSSETATQPASRRSPYSASSSPFDPRVMAPMGQTRTAPSRAAASRIARVMPAWSFTGSVFGIAHTAVNPPAAAARVPVAIVSLSSRPGCRKWVWRSMNPGQTTSPLTSITSAPRAATRVSSSATSPSTRRRSRSASRERPGSITRPPLRRRRSVMPPPLPPAGGRARPCAPRPRS